MQEFIYQENDYIKRQDLKDFEDMMLQYGFMPQEIEDEREYNMVFQFLINLTIKAPFFLLPYEFSLSMLSLLESDKELEALQKDLEQRWFDACERIAQKEDVFKKEVLWGWQENRPLIRGLFRKADQLWKKGKFKEANELFSNIFKTNENDNIGARYSVKATSEKMDYDEYLKKFTYSDKYGTFFKNEELAEWFGGD